MATLALASVKELDARAGRQNVGVGANLPQQARLSVWVGADLECTLAVPLFVLAVGAFRCRVEATNEQALFVEVKVAMRSPVRKVVALAVDFVVVDWPLVPGSNGAHAKHDERALARSAQELADAVDDLVVVARVATEARHYGHVVGAVECRPRAPDDFIEKHDEATSALHGKPRREEAVKHHRNRDEGHDKFSNGGRGFAHPNALTGGRLGVKGVASRRGGWNGDKVNMAQGVDGRRRARFGWYRHVGDLNFHGLHGNFVIVRRVVGAPPQARVEVHVDSIHRGHGGVHRAAR